MLKEEEKKKQAAADLKRKDEELATRVKQAKEEEKFKAQ